MEESKKGVTRIIVKNFKEEDKKREGEREGTRKRRERKRKRRKIKRRQKRKYLDRGFKSMGTSKWDFVNC